MGLREGGGLVGIDARNGCWIGQAPVTADEVTEHHGAGLGSGCIAYGDHQIHRRRIHELIPRLAAQSIDGHSFGLQLG